MKVIIHDLAGNLTGRAPFNGALSDVRVISPEARPPASTPARAGAHIRHCIGCFGCWVKTPGVCVIHDGFETMGALLGAADELCVISECVYGGFSPFVKNVLDRSIGYLSPFFRIVQGEMHHKLRYKNSLKFSAYFYGAGTTESEKALAHKLVAANALNMNLTVRSVSFTGSADTAVLLLEKTI